MRRSQIDNDLLVMDGGDQCLSICFLLPRSCLSRMRATRNCKRMGCTDSWQPVVWPRVSIGTTGPFSDSESLGFGSCARMSCPLVARIIFSAAPPDPLALGINGAAEQGPDLSPLFLVGQESPQPLRWVLWRVHDHPIAWLADYGFVAPMSPAARP